MGICGYYLPYVHGVEVRGALRIPTWHDRLVKEIGLIHILGVCHTAYECQSSFLIANVACRQVSVYVCVSSIHFLV